ncbi:hypothetical protein MRX96_007939 [Rhipicephalus microplus]
MARAAATGACLPAGKAGHADGAPRKPDTASSQSRAKADCTSQTVAYPYMALEIIAPSLPVRVPRCPRNALRNYAIVLSMV